jgi:hypothetical protein
MKKIYTPNHLWPWLLLGITGLLTLGLVRWTTAPVPVQAADTTTVEPFLLANTTSALCQFGVNAAANVNNFDTAALRMGWYLDYHARVNPSRPNGADYMPMIRLKQVKIGGQRTDDYTYSPSDTALLDAIAGNPGAAWIIGNEPDRIDVQDDMEPHVYAAAYHELYHLIKAADPNARILAGSIVQPTPLRLLYLDMVLQAYIDQFGQPMPVDAWSIHNFILREVSIDYAGGKDYWGADIPPGIDAEFGELLDVEDMDNMDLFVERIVRFRQWMKNRGYGHLPLYLTEYGILMPGDNYPPQRVNTFMNNTFDYMRSAQDPLLGYPGDNYRLVQKWSWFSTYSEFNGDLFNPSPPHNMTAMGQNFANYTAAIPEKVDLYPWRLSSQSDPIISGGDPVTLTLKVTIANSGNLTEPSGPALVRFYDGPPQSGSSQIGSDQFVSVAGCGRTAEAVITWPNVAPGVHTVYVWVDPNNEISETNADNNLKQFTVLVADPSIFLPVVARGFGS